jgi:multiple sugar transport system permease protein
MSASEAQDLVDQARGRRLRRIRQLDLGGLLLALVTLLATIVWAFPLIYATLGAFAPRDSSAGSGSLLLDIAATIGLYAHVLFGTEIGLWYVNSLVTSSAVTAGVLFISATCGYAISQLDFRGRKLLWVLILMSFMVPIQALIINHFFLMNQLHLINTWLGVILPQLIAPVAVIVYKQFFDSVPRELREAAMIDGATHRQLLFGVFLPVNWGITAALAIIVFIGAWNAFLWPFLVVTEEPLMNISVGITQARQAFGVGELAGALLTGLPVAVVYLIFQRRVTEAIIVSAGIKG